MHYLILDLQWFWQVNFSRNMASHKNHEEDNTIQICKNLQVSATARYGFMILCIKIYQGVWNEHMLSLAHFFINSEPVNSSWLALAIV